jgi:hypothetical protein
MMDDQICQSQAGLEQYQSNISLTGIAKRFQAGEIARET